MGAISASQDWIFLHSFGISRVIKNDFRGITLKIMGTLRYGAAEGCGEAVVRRQIVKITSGDVMSHVPLRLSRHTLVLLRKSA